METAGRVVVVGAANLDVMGFSAGALIAGDSNPGTVRFHPGGVGRNIAENLSRLGIPTSLITAVGGGLDGRFITESCRNSGIDTSLFIRSRKSAVSAYLAIMDHRGDMVLAVSDMEGSMDITPAALDERGKFLESASIIVVDGNVPEESLKYLAVRYPKPLMFADPVSVSKSQRLKSILVNLHTLKMNRLEAGALAGREISSDEDLYFAGAYLRKKGVQNIFITLGDQGVYWKNAQGEGIHRSDTVVPVNATGAGDAFTAAIVYASLRGYSTEISLSCASAAARIALSCEPAVNPGMSKQLLEKNLSGKR